MEVIAGALISVCSYPYPGLIAVLLLPCSESLKLGAEKQVVANAAPKKGAEAKGWGSTDGAQDRARKFPWEY